MNNDVMQNTFLNFYRWTAQKYASVKYHPNAVFLHYAEATKSMVKKKSKLHRGYHPNEDGMTQFNSIAGMYT